MPKLPLDGSVEAIYEDGYIHSETELNDISPYTIKNVFDDILHARPEAEHGKMVEFAVFYNDMRYAVNWKVLPENARPIRFKKMEMDLNGEYADISRLVGIDFGYQFTDENGQNVQQVQEIR